MSEITIVGGGLAGLTAAVACAETGAQVVVHEAHATLGGRARATSGPWIAHEGPHAFYADGPHWRWLVERDLVGPVVTVPFREAGRIRIHHHGRLRRTLPAVLLLMVAHRRRRAPVDVDFHSWAAALYGEEAARAAANLLGVVTFDHDPGRLSAAFVWDLLLRVTAPRAPAVRWPVGGWPAVVDRLAARARELGVRIVTSSRVDAVPEPPVIARLEHLLDLGFPRWRERVVWRRTGFAAGRSGALDLPGCTWRDRPVVDRGDGVFLAGDLVAAPGIRSEISINSALQAARLATSAPARTDAAGRRAHEASTTGPRRGSPDIH